MYAAGYAVRQRSIVACARYNLSAVKDASPRSGACLNRADIRKRMTDEQIKEGQLLILHATQTNDLTSAIEQQERRERGLAAGQKTCASPRTSARLLEI